MVLGKLQVLGRVLLIWIVVGKGLMRLQNVQMGVVWTFIPSFIIAFFSSSLRGTAKNRPKYCLKGPISQKQPTKQW